MSISYALVGAPNCGKTVLFNALTGAHAKVANYPGVTVDRREGKLVGRSDVSIIDLPGTYSLRVTSPDEQVARDVLLGKLGPNPDAIIAIADATNLRMTLRMILELKTLGLPMLVSLNLSDVAKARGLSINAEKLSQLLGLPVVETVAIKSSGTEALRQAIKNLPQTATPKLDTTAIEQQLDELNSNTLYREVEYILKEVVHTQMELPVWHHRIDVMVLHPVWGVVILLLILMLVFQAVYAWAEPIMGLIENGFGWLGEWVATTLPPGILSDLIINGIKIGRAHV